MLRFCQDALLTAKPLGKVGKKRARAGKGYKVWQDPRRARAGLQNLAKASIKASKSCDKLPKTSPCHSQHHQKKILAQDSSLKQKRLSHGTVHFARGRPIGIMRMRNHLKKSVALDNLCNDSQHHLVLK